MKSVLESRISDPPRFDGFGDVAFLARGSLGDSVVVCRLRGNFAIWFLSRLFLLLSSGLRRFLFVEKEPSFR